MIFAIWGNVYSLMNRLIVDGSISIVMGDFEWVETTHAHRTHKHTHRLALALALALALKPEMNKMRMEYAKMIRVHYSAALIAYYSAYLLFVSGRMISFVCVII